MNPLSLEAWKRGGLKVLCLGAHSDDIEIGCGGTILRILREVPGATVDWVVFAAQGRRAEEARASAAEFLAGAGQANVHCFEFEDSFFPSHAAEIKRTFETLKPIVPTVIFSHAKHDLHQDHRVIAELTWNTFRNHAILEYEIPKFDADLGIPNVFSPLSAEICDEKIRLIEKHFGSQRSKQWFDAELFRGMLRIRGVECCSATRYAEAFYGRKVVL